MTTDARRALVLLLLPGLLAMSCRKPAARPRLAIVDVTVVDVHDGSLKPHMTVLVAGERISAVSPSTVTRLPEHVRRIDGQAKYLIPGLWDMHVHSDGDATALYTMLSAGITGARDMGGDLAALAETRRQIDARAIAGPRLLIAGPQLVGPPSDPDAGVLVIHSAEDGRRAVDTLAVQHVDFINVHDRLSRDSFLAIADEAGRKGLPFAGHVPAFVSPAEASELGQKSLEHFEFLPKPCLALLDAATGGRRRMPAGCDRQALDELFRRFAARRTWVTPTIQSSFFRAPAQWDAIRSGFRELATLIRQDGVAILAGTDWSAPLEKRGAPAGLMLHAELASLVDAGFTPGEALRAATLNPAEFLGLSDSLGAVEAGKIADLLLLDANPLADIRNTRRMSAVISRGTLVAQR